jgi:uncharacterized protein (TIGR02646 family)
MRPVVRGERPIDSTRNQIIYTEYKNARSELIKRMGEYCSYCEMHLDASLAVEHVQPKQPANSQVLRDRELEWDNFLLACTNCNSTKGNADVVMGDYYWPDRDNTFRAFTYSVGGKIRPSSDSDFDKAARTINLTGLDKNPINDIAASDRRWQNRREAWDIAVESKIDLSKNNTQEMRRQIVRSVKGYWSVWMTVFQDDPDMIKRFIDAFPGTARDCFDASQNYTPVQRPHGQI